ncbi:hypothetical protein O4H49_03535 [Kiloniella laminariae]|uniref:Uncharacterized protein n=1 Tax=Kiloniella laminariae TaxID=454162 RepID=A0ABT4LFF5_9PROT|nr:hypothetical protein [Kiloniella laminariae]MCZ4279835.1 hypothetical protein [Kiloniella laminariae]
MAFRANEAEQNGLEKALNYLIPKGISATERPRSKEVIIDIIDKCGPVVESYPSWHPLVSNNRETHFPITKPSAECGYKGLDHTIYFVNGFITCPYGDWEAVVRSVDELPDNKDAHISAEKLDLELYNTGTTAILVRCEWYKPLGLKGTIPKSLALPLLIEQEFRKWRDAQFAETWETMSPYFLGTPHGSRSSLFVDQETGLTLKKIWNSLINTGMYGPIMV